MALMTAAQLIAKAKEVQKTNTVYMWGTYGRPLTNDLIDAKAKQYPTKNTPTRVAKHKKLAGKGYSAWDCVGLIKGILWGWAPGVVVPYAVNGVPDVGSDSMYKNYCTNQSTNFAGILPGEAVWMAGHIGIYIGDGLVIEATSRWDDKVMITALGNHGTVKGYQTRSWTHHGRLKWIDYAGQPVPEPEPSPAEYTVKVNSSIGLNVRQTPNGKVLKVLKNGTQVVISKEQKDSTRTWGYTAAHKGWVALDFTVRVTPPKPDPPAPTPPAPAPSPSAAITWMNANRLKRGDRGKLVEAAQTALIMRGYDVGGLDGVFGPATDRAVRALQTAHKIAVDGWIGKDTWSILLGDK